MTKDEHKNISGLKYKIKNGVAVELDAPAKLTTLRRFILTTLRRWSLTTSSL